MLDLSTVKPEDIESLGYLKKRTYKPCYLTFFNTHLILKVLGSLWTKSSRSQNPLILVQILSWNPNILLNQGVLTLEPYLSKSRILYFGKRSVEIVPLHKILAVRVRIHSTCVSFIWSDIHIGMENYAKLDPETGLSTRLLSIFFKTFDFIVRSGY